MGNFFRLSFLIGIFLLLAGLFLSRNWIFWDEILQLLEVGFGNRGIGNFQSFTWINAFF
jgi:hypothetical protein